MQRHDSRDLAGGLALTLFGLAGATYALAHYDTGTVRMMGPGMIPAAVGFLLALTGACIALPAWSRSRSLPRVEWRAVFHVSLGVAAFAVTVRPFGIALAIFLLTALSARADRQASLRVAALLGLVLACGGYAVFRYALNIPLAFVAWPL